MTSKFCVVGSPIEHSLSPVIHQAAYSHLGFDFVYERHEVPTGKLRIFTEDNDFSGLSVTMPLKQEAFLLADLRSDSATATGVANTLVQDSSGWVAHNTDVFGITQCIKSRTVAQQVVVLGSGATARSSLVAMKDLYPLANLVIVARSSDSAKEILDFAKAFTDNVSLESASVDALLSADLVASTVPATGFESLWLELAASAKKPDGLLLDVTYNPWPSVASRAWGANSVSGLEMLIWQAVQQVRLFAESRGESSDFDSNELFEVMKEAVAESN
jgi:shikimate dehydrogenase